MTDRSDVIYVVTGATSGIGLATVSALARTGASVVAVGRSRERCAEALESLRAQQNTSNISFEQADLSSRQEIRELADRIQRRYNAIDALINNAGTFTMRREITVDREELQFAVNHLAPFLLTNLLLPQLIRSTYRRVIAISSGSHFQGQMRWHDLGFQKRYNGLRAYEQTKLANVLVTYGLHNRYHRDYGLHSYAVDPGLIRTEMGFKGKGVLSKLVWAYRKSRADSPEKGAETAVYLATREGAPPSGTYWKNLEPLRSSPSSYSLESAERLWSISETKCAVGTPAISVGA